MSRKRVVMYSGGVGSWATAKRVVEKHGTDGLVLLFADTKIEDEDLYRFVDESAANVGGELVKLQEGRDPWQVFFDERFLGNSRIDPCSKILKRKFLRRWLEEHCDPEQTSVYIGIDWTEEHRYDRSKKYWDPWVCYAPLIRPPYLTKTTMLDWLRAEGIQPPRLYEMGFPHNNCGGFCIKAGQAQFKLLLETLPERYAYHEKKERELQRFLGKKVTILRKMVNKKYRRYSLEDLRKDVQAGKSIDEQEWGGCACFVPSDQEVGVDDLMDSADTLID